MRHRSAPRVTLSAHLVRAGGRPHECELVATAFPPPPAAPQDATCTLSKKTRLIGFGSCLGIGLLISFLSFFFWTKPVSFALLYTLGNIVAVAATGFLIGFMRQLKAAFARKRVIATVAFVAAMIGTLLAVFLVHSIPLAVVCVIIQFCALGACARRGGPALTGAAAPRRARRRAHHHPPAWPSQLQCGTR